MIFMKQRNVIYTSKCHIRVIFASKYHFIILRTKILKNMSNWKWSPTVHDLEKLSVRQSNKIYLSKHCTIFTWILINFCLFLIQNSFKWKEHEREKIAEFHGYGCMDYDWHIYISISFHRQICIMSLIRNKRLLVEYLHNWLYLYEFDIGLSLNDFNH